MSGPRVALVTGAARGIGRACALALARDGAAVAAADLIGLDETLGALARHGGGALGLPLDVTLPASVGAVVDRTVAELGRVDILVTAAGIAIDRINEEVDINIACSLGMLTQRQVGQLKDWGVHRYNHNLETARSYFPEVVTTHTYEERLETCAMVKGAGIELCCGALIGMGAVVLRDVPAGMVVVGNPARPLVRSTAQCGATDQMRHGRVGGAAASALSE